MSKLDRMVQLNFELDPTVNAWTTTISESCNKQCAINRESRIREINKVLFDDLSDKPYLNWRFTRDKRTNRRVIIEDTLSQCFCGHVIENVGIWERDCIRLIVGSECEKKFEGFEDYMKEENDVFKTCQQCGGRKHYEGTLCSKCEKKCIICKTNNKSIGDNCKLCNNKIEMKNKLEADRIKKEKEILLEYEMMGNLKLSSGKYSNFTFLKVCMRDVPYIDFLKSLGVGCKSEYKKLCLFYDKFKQQNSQKLVV